MLGFFGAAAVVQEAGTNDVLASLVTLGLRVPAAIQSWLYYADLISLWALEISGRRATTRLYWGVRCSDMDQSKYQRGLRWAIAACVSRSARPDAVVANSFAGRDAHLRLGYAPRAFPVRPDRRIAASDQDSPIRARPLRHDDRRSARPPRHRALAPCVVTPARKSSA